LRRIQSDHEQLKLKAQNQENKIKELSIKNQSSAKFTTFAYENDTPFQYTIMENSYALNARKKNSEKPKTKKCPVKNCDGRGNKTSAAGKWHSTIRNCPNFKNQDDSAENTNTTEVSY
jgi:hypothetical protein